MAIDNPFIVGGLLFIVGLAVGYVIRQAFAAKRKESAEKRIEVELETAREKAQGLVREAQEKAIGLLEEVKKEERETKVQLSRLEERLLRKEEQLEKQAGEFRSRDADLIKEREHIKTAEEEVDGLKRQAIDELEKLAGFSAKEAKELLLKDLRTLYEEELAQEIQKLEHEKHEEIERRSLEVITSAVQRYARAHVGDVTTSVFTLTDEDLKGKIIGREGRNIRALERATGVEFVIDETPDTIIISSFDPLRREIARSTLEKLIKDGRIQPAKIEEKAEEAKNEIDKRMNEIGEAAAYELGIYDLPKEIIQLLGRLHFRTSFGQNVLTHSIEMAHISGMIAAQLGANGEVARRGALLHDIGKAIDHEVQGTHVELGRGILKKYGISDEVIAAMQSHHEEYPFSTPESFIVTAADVLSAARPGARRGTVENYIKRLADLEKIAKEFPGVKDAYAISAGRELRVFVTPEKIDDFGALQLARNIATKIESELKYPGEIKVNVIREMRAVEYAR